jgi:hypothetical protein
MKGQAGFELLVAALLVVGILAYYNVIDLSALRAKLGLFSTVCSTVTVYQGHPNNLPGQVMPGSSTEVFSYVLNCGAISGNSQQYCYTNGPGGRMPISCVNSYSQSFYLNCNLYSPASVLTITKNVCTTTPDNVKSLTLTAKPYYSVDEDVIVTLTSSNLDTTGFVSTTPQGSACYLNRESCNINFHRLAVGENQPLTFTVSGGADSGFTKTINVNVRRALNVQFFGDVEQVGSDGVEVFIKITDTSGNDIPLNILKSSVFKYEYNGITYTPTFDDNIAACKNCFSYLGLNSGYAGNYRIKTSPVPTNTQIKFTAGGYPDNMIGNVSSTVVNTKQASFSLGLTCISGCTGDSSVNMNSNIVLKLTATQTSKLVDLDTLAISLYGPDSIKIKDYSLNNGINRIDTGVYTIAYSFSGTSQQTETYTFKATATKTVPGAAPITSNTAYNVNVKPNNNGIDWSYLAIGGGVAVVILLFILKMIGAF